MSVAGTTPAERVRWAHVSEQPLSVDRMLAAVSEPHVGGVALFVGLVRNHDSGHDVRSLDYTHHPVAESMLRDCAARVAAHHEVSSIALEHRTGHLAVGDLAVVVAVGAVHRAEALAACAELIDDVKATVPIWKEQHFEGGRTEWVGLT
jgi:molybdopterin synthase catalytic subunit